MKLRVNSPFKKPKIMPIKTPKIVTEETSKIK